MRRQITLSLILMLAAAGNAFAGGEARMAGKVVDGVTRQPIADALIKYEAIEGKTVKNQTKSKADGSFAVFVLDGTLRYKFTVSAPGYVAFEETMKLALGGTRDKVWELFKPGVRVVDGKAEVEPQADPSVLAYNEGAALANAKDYPAAIARFEQAVALKPELTAAWMALAKMQLRQKEYDKAIVAAGKVLEIDDSDNDMNAVMHEAYLAKGDKANAAKYGSKLPKNANVLYNDAAKRINAGDDAGAETLLQQAIAIDGSFALAHYELGMVYVRTGKNAEAKASLAKYLELDPNGANASTARDVMKYLK